MTTPRDHDDGEEDFTKSDLLEDDDADEHASEYDADDTRHVCDTCEHMSHEHECGIAECLIDGCQCKEFV